MQKPLLLLGVDPGTTLGMALITLEGDVVHIWSSKVTTTSSVVLECIKYGRVVAVGTDKAKIPHKVKEIAGAFGARIISPDQDLDKNHKKLLANQKTANDHESDALSAARFCRQELYSLLAKVKHFCRLHKSDELFDSMFTHALSQATHLHDVHASLQPKPASSAESKKKQHVMLPLEVRKRLSKLEDKIAYLEQENETLKSQLQPKTTVKVKTIRSPATKHQDNIIARLTKKLEHKNNLLQAKTKELQKVSQFVHLPVDHVVLKKLNNLGKQEWRRKSWMRISQGDLLLVSNPHVVSTEVCKTLEQLQCRVFSHKQSDHTVFLQAEHLTSQSVDFAVAHKDFLEQSNNLLGSLVKEYQSARKAHFNSL